MFVQPTGMKVLHYGVNVKNNIKKMYSVAKDAYSNSNKNVFEDSSMKTAKILIKESYKYIGKNIKNVIEELNPFKKV